MVVRTVPDGGTRPGRPAHGHPPVARRPAADVVEVCRCGSPPRLHYGRASDFHPGAQPRWSHDPARPGRNGSVGGAGAVANARTPPPTDYRRRRSEEHTSELQSLMRSAYAVIHITKTEQHNKQQSEQNHN